MNLIEELLKENKSFTKEANKKKVEGFEEKVNKIDRIISKIRKEFSNYPRAIEEVEYDSEPAGFRITDRVHEDEIKDYIENNFSDKDLRYIDSGDYYRVRFESCSSKRSKKKVVKESEMTIEDIISDAKRHAERYILEKNLEEKGYYAVCYAVLENKGRMVTTGVDMYINSPVFIAYSPEDYESFVNNYKGVFDESPSDYKFYTIYNKSYVQEGLDEDTVKKSNGKWTNRGDDGTEHGEFGSKKKADDQRKEMYANGFKGESVKKLKEDYDDDQAFEQFVSDMKKYPGFVEVSKICQDCGYVLFWLSRGKYGTDITIRARDKYHSEIYRHKISRNTYEFEAQTTAYGSLGPEEYEKFKDAVGDTYNLLVQLNSIDFDSLDIIKIEDE